MKTEIFPFGVTADGQAVTAYRLENAAGAALTVLDYGATIQALTVPDKTGGVTDVVLGYDTIEAYETGTCFLGSTIGRVGNRIGGAAFSLGGVTYTLAKNDGENHLHGGVRGFDRRMWTIRPQGDSALVCTYRSPDGEEGYPGNLSAAVTLSLTDRALVLDYEACSDKDTLVNLTNHSYFNLNGGGSVPEHEMQIFAERFCENDAGCLPTGKLLDVEGTPFDFRQPKAIGRDIETHCEQLRRGNGYDHNFVLGAQKAAVLFSARTGLEMTVFTTLPGIQLYTSNGLTEGPGKEGIPMVRRGAVCLETQLWPNGMNCYGFPSPVLRAGQTMRSQTVYQFALR